MQISLKIEGLDQLGNFAGQVPFALASALTKTAKQGQDAVIQNLQDTFTLRTNWYKPSNAIGIRITPAKKNDQVAEVRSAAKFLLPHVEGKDKIPFGKFLAIPTDNVRRNKRRLIPNPQRPKNLKNSFILTLKSGLKVLAVRVGKGRRSTIRIMYLLEPKARLKKAEVFFEPVQKVVKENFENNFNESIKKAIKTAR